MCFVNSIIHEFTPAQTNEDIDFIIPPWLFEVKKKIVQTNADIEFIIPPWLFEVKKKIALVEIPHCVKNESSCKQFIKKFDQFTTDTFNV